MQRKYEAALIPPAALSMCRLHFQSAKQHTKEKAGSSKTLGVSKECGGRKKGKIKIFITSHYDKNLLHWLLAKNLTKQKPLAWYSHRKKFPQHACYNKPNFYTVQER